MVVGLARSCCSITPCRCVIANDSETNLGRSTGCRASRRNSSSPSLYIARGKIRLHCPFLLGLPTLTLTLTFTRTLTPTFTLTLRRAPAGKGRRGAARARRRARREAAAAARADGRTTTRRLAGRLASRSTSARGHHRSCLQRVGLWVAGHCCSSLSVFMSAGTSLRIRTRTHHEPQMVSCWLRRYLAFMKLCPH